MTKAKYLRIVGIVEIVFSIITIIVYFIYAVAGSVGATWAISAFGANGAALTAITIVLIWVAFFVLAFFTPAIGILFLTVADLADSDSTPRYYVKSTNNNQKKKENNYSASSGLKKDIYNIGEKITFKRDASIKGHKIEKGMTGVVEKRLYTTQGRIYTVVLDSSKEKIDITSDYFE